MAASALPIVKLGSLLVKTLAKPASRRVKHEFSRNENTRKLLIAIGQTTHSVTSRLTIWSSGYSVKKINAIPEEEALANGADFVGEGFVFLVGGGLAVYEYNRSNEKARKKEEEKHKKAEEFAQSLQRKLNALDERLSALEEVVKKQNNSIFNLTKKNYVEPAVKSIAIDDSRIIDKEGNLRKGTEGITLVQSGKETETIASDYKLDVDGESQKSSNRWRWWPMFRSKKE